MAMVQVDAIIDVMRDDVCVLVLRGRWIQHPMGEVAVDDANPCGRGAMGRRRVAAGCGLDRRGRVL